MGISLDTAMLMNPIQVLTISERVNRMKNGVPKEKVGAQNIGKFVQG